MQYFCYVDSTDPRDSWVFSGSPSRVDWLNMQMGLTPLVHSTAQYHANSLLSALWEYAAYERDASRGLPLDMLRLRGIHENAQNLQRNSYRQALRSLAPLMLVERCINNLIKYLSCLAGLNKKLFAKAQVNDHRALLILAYGLGLMCYVKFWGLGKSIKIIECVHSMIFLPRHVVTNWIVVASIWCQFEDSKSLAMTRLAKFRRIMQHGQGAAEESIVDRPECVPLWPGQAITSKSCLIYFANKAFELTAPRFGFASSAPTQ